MLLNFEKKIGEQEKPWVPYIVCETCVANLRGWSNGKLSRLAFGVSIVWRDP